MSKINLLEYVSRLAKAVITLLLIMFIVFIAQLLVTELIWQYTYEKPSPPKFPDDQQWRIHRAEKLFLPDGTMHLVRRIDEQDTGDYIKEEITDVNGNVLWQGIHDERPFKYLAWPLSPGEYNEFFSERQMRNILFSSIPEMSGVCEVPVRVGGEVKEVWQYDFEADAFAGYKVGGGLMGYLGADGFVTSRAQPFGEFKGFTAWTDKDPSAVVMLWLTKRRIYQIDFRGHKVETIFNSTQSDIESIRWHQWRPMNPKDRDISDIRYRPLIDCETADRSHHLIMRESNHIITVKLPEQMWPTQMFGYWKSKVNFAATGNAVFLEYYERGFNPPQSHKLLEQYQREYNSKPRPQSLQLYKVADGGKLELVNQFDWIRPLWDTPYPPDHREIYKKWVSKITPPVFNLLWYLFGDDLYELSRRGMGMVQVYAVIITEIQPRCSFLNYILSVAMMAFALWHGWSRRTSWGRLILWLIIIGAFNLAGLLTYLGLNHTPVIKCPVCGRKRGLEKSNCVQCGNTLPVPQRRPTDLIQPGVSH